MKTEQSHNDKDTFLAKWLAGDLSDETLKTLVSEADFNSFLKIRKGIEAYEVLESPIEESFAKIQNHIEKKEVKVRPLHTKAWVLGIAASIVLFIGLFTIIGDDIVTVTTNFGEQKTVALLDGSEVILNSKSTITYDEKTWASKRTLFLEGEAFFKVNTGAAFTVNTANGAIEVLGTQFNVNTVSDLLEVVCFEGKVSVTTMTDTIILLPTNSVRRINGNATEQWNTEATKPTWIDGESTFKSVPLHYVIKALEAQYNITIDAKDIDATTIYTGSFTHKDLNTALKTVFKSLQIQYTEKEKGNIYLNSK